MSLAKIYSGLQLLDKPFIRSVVNVEWNNLREDIRVLIKDL